LAEYLIVSLGTMATHLGWTDTSDEILLTVEDTLEVLGLALEADSTDPVALKAVARYIAWVNVCNNLSMDYDYKSDKESFSRSQMFKHAKEMLATSMTEALPWLSTAQIEIGEFTFVEDPYIETELTEFEL
ncbi:unnamed protein product, partial [marine sediment metagenome]